MTRILLIVGIILVFMALLGSVHAVGILELHDPGRGPEAVRTSQADIFQRQAACEKLHLSVEIENQVAQTTLDQVFRNPTDRRLEGTFLFALPPRAALRDMSLYIDGKPVACEVIEADKARDIYEGIVRRMQDPALLEYVGRDLVRLRIFPIEPRSTRRVTFTYSQLLQRDGGLLEYRFPLAARGGPDQRIGELVVEGRVHSTDGVSTVYSPSHDIEFVRDKDQTTFGLEERDHRAVRDLQVYVAFSDESIGASLLTFRPDPENPGTFLLLIAPSGVRVDDTPRVAKDITFVLDTSGSMQGEKIEQAREALTFCLRALRPEDRFRVIRFSTTVAAFRDKAVHAFPGNVSQAVAFVDGFRATGGTAIHDALQAALIHPEDSARPHMVVFLTDGLPTVGETDVEAIVDDTLAERGEDGRTRIFTFGVGYDVNTTLLDDLARETRAAADYVTPEEDIEVRVGGFFRKISDPVLTDVTLEFDGVRVEDVYPRQLPDLFSGTEIALLGHYSEADKARLVMSGKAGGTEHTWTYEMDFGDSDPDAEFLPRLWAVRRVAHLMDEIRRHGEKDELREEIVRLGEMHGIATPYTSMLVVEDDAVISNAPTPARDRDEFWLGGVGRMQTAEAMCADTGQVAVQTSRELRKMKEAKQLKGDMSALRVRYVSGRRFELRNKGLQWTQTEWKKQVQTRKVIYMEEDWFALTRKSPDLAKILALGKWVVFEWDGVWYETIEAAN